MIVYLKVKESYQNVYTDAWCQSKWKTDEAICMIYSNKIDHFLYTFGKGNLKIQSFKFSLEGEFLRWYYAVLDPNLTGIQHVPRLVTVC